MKENENQLLEKLLAGLEDAGVSPIPDRRFLLQRICDKIEKRELAAGQSDKKIIDAIPDNYSPVCFAKGDEVQADYLSEEEILRKIEGYIDRLISSK
ncbi:hypothetical protein LV84_03016 [Algoriphagus ratkowskyi]|uniref:Uncharacterized protein n=1 Tax=Algoriphagus ratkowskyi TaxID=57028 RepID=A0A2W7QZF8_9BACT|nr:hypothetical protein [Algoriphagus ratkowskyi]PZX53908.1 hypothetical protein LV84_03016 [Algoriphagus ratkowskyi]TXD76689.1 hypothetical protein ESW18_15110 [Algoriphagus ratkowskyi]